MLGYLWTPPYLSAPKPLLHGCAVGPSLDSFSKKTLKLAPDFFGGGANMSGFRTTREGGGREGGCVQDHCALGRGIPAQT